ncbi:MAG: glycosyltransferase, partial [bacterium]
GTRARFLTDLPREEMPSVYRAADLFALCSPKETLGTAFLEALASGVPCLGNRFPVIEWVIGDGGRTLGVEEPGALAAAIPQFLNPALRAEVGANARRHALERFSKTVVIDQQIQMYREVLADDGRRPGVLTKRDDVDRQEPIAR